MTGERIYIQEAVSIHRDSAAEFRPRVTDIRHNIFEQFWRSGDVHAAVGAQVFFMASAHPSVTVTMAGAVVDTELDLGGKSDSGAVLRGPAQVVQGQVVPHHGVAARREARQAVRRPVCRIRKLQWKAIMN